MNNVKKLKCEAKHDTASDIKSELLCEYKFE